MFLSELGIGKDAVIQSVNTKDIALRKHILDMGLTPGTEVTLIKVAPMGDPLEIRLRGYELTLRKDEAARIQIEDVHTAHNEAVQDASGKKDIAHPHTGEEGIYHTRGQERPLPENTVLTFGLAGNQNCGKTTLFNQLTGSNQHVGNFPGVTVDRKSGMIRKHTNTDITDLPGIYSMSPYTSEEIVTRNFFLDDKPKGIINIVDATNMERNLYLTMQLIEMEIPMVLALNMMDEMRSNGGSVNVNQMEALLGIPVIPISASKNEGVDELIDHALHVAKYQEKPGRVDFCDPDDERGGAVHRAIHSIEHLIEDHSEAAQIPLRFAATKLIEEDSEVLGRLKLDENEQATLRHIVKQMEEETGTDRLAALADMRFRFIEEICRACVIKPKESKEHIRSLKIDKILTGRFTAIPAFLVIMGLVFWMTFGLIGGNLQKLMDHLIKWLTGMIDLGLTVYGINPVVKSLVVDGICAGVGAVLSFLPVIIVLFFFLSLLEDTGYMARIAFVMDRPLRKLGLSGRSFVPMLVGFGCSVPAIMATRTLPSERDRKMTILLTPFMSCTAKVPIYALLCAVFFPGRAVLVTVSLYLLGIVAAILFALIMKRTTFKGKPVPFVMELPNYRFPSAKNVVLLMWEKAKDFVTRAFTIIFVATVIVWFLQTFNTRLNVVTDVHSSMLAGLGSLIAVIFRPLGIGSWEVSTALITGFIAKESVISTLTVLLGGSAAAIGTLFTPFSAFVFLVFTLLYTPCVAAISTVRKELGRGWAIWVVVFQCVIAWAAAMIVRLIGMLIGVA